MFSFSSVGRGFRIQGYQLSAENQIAHERELVMELGFIGTHGG